MRRRVAGVLLAALLGAAACGADEGEPGLRAHVSRYCNGFAASLHVAAQSVRQGQLHSVGIGPVRRGTGDVLNQRLHFCAGAREGWGDPSSPAMAAAQDFSSIANRLDALFVRAGPDADPSTDEVAGLLEEMAPLAEDVAQLPLRP
ncbi:MAG TPA: hypothetical protein RMH99_22310 [Sandaracinaceae bacterium LLY-WYZ-13_1]|nr:hypothetical protein [Sandaracinaceae bacterium LLY-WYZ-13_1]